MPGEDPGNSSEFYWVFSYQPGSVLTQEAHHHVIDRIAPLKRSRVALEKLVVVTLLCEELDLTELLNQLPFVLNEGADVHMAYRFFKALQILLIVIV